IPNVSASKSGAPQKAHEAGEFTAAFQDFASPPSVAHNPIPVSESTKNPSIQGPRTTTPPPTRHESGAFTKQFLAALQEDPAPNQVQKPVARGNSEPVASEPGSFTKEFFQVGTHTPSKETHTPRDLPLTFGGTNSSSATGSHGKTGEFTQFFRGMPVEKS